jgi:hypothetical protein
MSDTCLNRLSQRPLPCFCHPHKKGALSDRLAGIQHFGDRAPFLRGDKTARGGMGGIDRIAS